MAHYIKLAEEDIQVLGGRYDLKISSYEPIEQGAGNSNYLLHTNYGMHILTVFEIEPVQVEHMCKVLLLLKKHDFPAPRIKIMANGEVLSYFYQKPVLVKPFIKGYVEAEIDAAKAKQVGGALAQLHKIPAPDYLPDTHSYVEKTFPKIMGQEINRKYSAWVRKRYRSFMENIPSQLPFGLVHGDIFFDNVLFEDENFKAILDFEEVSRTYKIFDLGMAAVGICTTGTDVVLQKVKALIDGYQEIRLLEDNEKDSLQLCIEWAATLTSTWRFWKYNMDIPDADKAEEYLQMVSIAKKTSAIPEKEFKLAVFS